MQWRLSSILLMAVFLISAQDALIKLAGGQLSLWQLTALRAVFGLPFLFLISRFVTGIPLQCPHNWRAVILRTGLMVLSLTIFFASLVAFGMARAAAGLYTAPVFVALFTYILGEAGAFRLRLITIGTGFLGAVLVLQPQQGHLNLMSFLPVLAGCTYAAGNMVTRQQCQGESAFTLAAATQAAHGLVGLVGLSVLAVVNPGSDTVNTFPFFLRAWQTLTIETVLIIVCIAALSVIAQSGIARAYQAGQPIFLASIDYTYLIFAAFWGWLLWDVLPSPLMMAGIMLIAASGIMNLVTGKLE